MLTNADAIGVSFEQTGFAASIISDRAFNVTVSPVIDVESAAVSDDTRAASANDVSIRVKAGTTSFCLLNGTFTVTPDPCFQFQHVCQIILRLHCICCTMLASVMMREFVICVGAYVCMHACCSDSRDSHACVSASPFRTRCYHSSRN
jgi:hypothetical protein